MSRIGLGRCAAAGAMLTALLVGLSRADEIHLSGGSILRGVAVPDDAKPGYFKVYTPTIESPLSLRKDRIERVDPSDTPLREYLDRLSATPDTGEAQLALAQWCDQNGLTGPAQHHYKVTVVLDPQNGPAHEKLGHVFWDGAWRTYAEMRQSQGLVLHHGKWVTAEEKARLDQSQRETASQKAWGRRITNLLKSYYQAPEAGRAKAEQELRSIREPEAIIPLVNILGQESPELRLLLVEVLGQISDPQATAGLVHRLLSEPDDQIRGVAFNQIAHREDREGVNRLIQALQDRDPVRVGRAASALSALQATEAVPELIPALTSVQRRVEVVMTPVQSGGMGFSAGFSRVQGISTLPGPTGAVSGGGAGYFNNVPSFPVLTGPVSAPGVVAFGATAAPVVSGTGFSTGGGSTQMVPTEVVVSYQHQNADVLAALTRLTGRDFGYNVEQWKQWLRREYRPPAVSTRPERRVPQP